VYVVRLTTAQPTYIDDDKYDLRCEDTTCGRNIDNLQTRLSQVQEELQQQRQQIKKLANRISKIEKPGERTIIETK